MTIRQKYKANIKLIKLYDAYLPYCETWESKSKLICEIARLTHENKEIESMPFADTQKQIITYEISL